MLASWFTNPLENKSTHTVVGLETKGLGAVSRLKFTHTPWHPPTRGLWGKNPKTIWVPYQAPNDPKPPPSSPPTPNHPN
jgi:hypothetical protein